MSASDMSNRAQITTLRAQITTQVPKLAAPDAQQTWWLLGTAGCHLCTEAETLLSHFQLVQPIAYVQVDIADFDNILMMDFADNIPVLLTTNTRLNYPFSVMDLQQLMTLSQ